MRILYVTQNYLPEPGAGPGRVSEMARDWVQAGHQVEVLAPVPNAPTGVVPDEYRGRLIFRQVDPFGVEVTRTWIYATPNRGRTRRSLAFGSFAAMSVLTGIFATHRPDVVIGSSPQLLAAAGGGAIATLLGVPWIFEVRDLWPESVIAVGAMTRRHPVVRTLFGVADAMYASARRIVVVTEAFRTILLERGIPAHKLAVVENGVELAKFSPRAASAADRAELGGSARLIVSYLGTHGMAHDLGRLLDVATRLRHRKDIAFAFVGDGAERSALEARSRAEGLDNVRFLGVQPRERMPALYAASDLCVVPLRNDAVFNSVLPSKIFEIMGMEKPLVVAVDGEARRIVQESRAGRFVPPGDSGALHDAILDLLAEPDMLAEMGRQGRAYVAANYDRGVLAKRYLTVLTEAAARPA